MTDAARSYLLVIDIQEKRVPAVHQSEALLERARWLTGIAHRLGVPMLASEQYPRDLGTTVDPVAEALGKTRHWRNCTSPAPPSRPAERLWTPWGGATRW